MLFCAKRSTVSIISNDEARQVVYLIVLACRFGFGHHVANDFGMSSVLRLESGGGVLLLKLLGSDCYFYRL